MKNSKILMTGVALAFLAGGVSSAFAQAVSATDQNPTRHKKTSHGLAARTESESYRPLTVGASSRPVAGAAEAVAAPVGFGAGLAGGIVGGAVGGASTIVSAPFAGLSGGPVGISPDVAPPLPIKARYMRTGPVASTIEEGYQQPVPVDKSGPIYQLDTDATARTVTPFSLLAFPITGVTSAITSPLRPGV